jgi:predicted transposase/invertase (TIGR01784 family)
MKTDSIFYQIFLQLPSVFFELKGESPQKADIYSFQSVEVKQTSKRIDGIFFPEKESEQTIYFTEVQFQNDPEFYDRLFGEIFLYLSQNKPRKPWQAVIFFPSRSIDLEIPIEYQICVNDHNLKVIYLEYLALLEEKYLGVEMVKLIGEKNQNAVSTAKKLVQKTQAQLTDKLQQRKVLELLETIVIYKLPYLDKKELEAMFTFTELKQTKYFQDLAEEKKLEGKLEGKLEVLPELLELGLNAEKIAKILNIDVKIVVKLMKEIS